MGATADRWLWIDGAAPAGEAALPADSPGLLQLLTRLRESAVRIDRMSCADAAGQLAAAITRPIDTVLCSLLDADSTAPLNATVAEDHFAIVQSAVAWLAGATGATRTLYVADRTATTPEVRRPAALLRIAHAYPQLHPSLLLRIALRRRLSPGRLPTDTGVIAIDAAAAWVLSQLIEGAPRDLLALPWSVHDERLGKTAFVLSPPQRTIADVARAAGFDPTDARNPPAIQLGPRVVNRAIDRDTALRSAGEWTIHLAPPTPPQPPDPCTRCGWCRAVCPAGVEPVLILEAVQARDRHRAFDLAERAGLHDCVHCGLCQFVCPSRLPLLQAIDTITPSENPLASGH